MPVSRPMPLTRNSAYKRLKKLTKQPGIRDHLWYHCVGQEVAQLYPAKKRGYGRNQMKLLVEALDRTISASNLWVARRFSAQYDHIAVERLSKPRKGKVFKLTWSRMIPLLSLNNNARQSFERRCIKAEWSSRELRNRVREDCGQPHPGGRRYRRPTSLADGLRQLIAESDAWQRRFQRVWFDPDRPAIDWDDAEATDDVAELCGRAAAIFASMQCNIQRQLPSLRKHARPGKPAGRGRKSQ